MYKHILLATDLSELGNVAMRRAQELAIATGAKLSIVHIMEHSPLAYGGEFSIPIDVNVELKLESYARQALDRLANSSGVKPDDIYIEQGPVKTAVTQLATRLNIDLIVIGTHGHHGLDVLLGSRATAILHQAKCDVLAVRVG